MKRWRVFTKRRAEEDANEIWRLIAEDNLHAAEAFLDAIEEASNLLSATPEIGSPHYFPILNFRDSACYPCAILKSTAAGGFKGGMTLFSFPMSGSPPTAAAQGAKPSSGGFADRLNLRPVGKRLQ